VLTVINTAASDAFLDSVNRDSTFLVVDEVHRAGSAMFRRVLELDAPSRLGLSATPERAGDPGGTQLLLDYFGGIVHSYGLVHAIRDEVLGHLYEPGQRWLVYCDSRQQMAQVLAELRGRGLGAVEYHSAMTGSEPNTIREFELNGGRIVAIRCLDEGVDIPSASHALILASSRNPREFIQRRGRVLRLSPGKTLSHVHDAIVIPNRSVSRRIADEVEGAVWAELARAMEFAKSALNPESRTALERLCIDLGFDLDAFSDPGFEVDDPNDPTVD
jgi:superfamily II DNA or RNA helicase